MESAIGHRCGHLNEGREGFFYRLRFPGVDERKCHAESPETPAVKEQFNISGGMLH